jgi:hypothetical protein
MFEHREIIRQSVNLVDPRAFLQVDRFAGFRALERSLRRLVEPATGCESQHVDVYTNAAAQRRVDYRRSRGYRGDEIAAQSAQLTKIRERFSLDSSHASGALCLRRLRRRYSHLRDPYRTSLVGGTTPRADFRQCGFPLSAGEGTRHAI